MRISEWSSDVCSSDLRFLHPEHGVGVEIGAFGREDMGGQAFEAFLSDHEVNMRGTIGVPFRRREHLAHRAVRSEGHTSELQSLMRTSYAVLCLKTKTVRTTATADRQSIEWYPPHR